MENQRAGGIASKSQGTWKRQLGIKSQQDPGGTEAIFLDGDYASDLVEDWEIPPTGADSLISEAWLFEASSWHSSLTVSLFLNSGTENTRGGRLDESIL